MYKDLERLLELEYSNKSDFEELFEFKSDDIKLKDYFPLVYAKLRTILAEVEG